MARHKQQREGNDETLPSVDNERPKPEPSHEPAAKTLATVTWLGEGEDGPRFNEWNGIRFEVGKPQEITNPRMIEKAKTNRFYEVTESGKEQSHKDGPAEGSGHQQAA